MPPHLNPSAPPPAYSSPPLPAHSPSLPGLPSHLLLHILSHLSLPDLILRVRLTSTQLHLLSTHLARHQLLPIYTSHISSPSHLPPQTSRPPAFPAARELVVLDLFIAACAVEASKSAESPLHLLASASRAAHRDLFSFLQPRARVEDLVMRYAVADRVAFSSSPTPAASSGGGTVDVSDIKIDLEPRRARLTLPFRRAGESARVVETVHKVVGETARDGAEALEVVAERLVRALARVRVWREEGVGRGGRVVGWYERG